MEAPTMLKALWRYRGFVASSVLREFNGKYRESLRIACFFCTRVGELRNAL